MINSVSMKIQNKSQSKSLKNSKNINFKASFINNNKYKELCNYAEENAIRSKHFKEAIEKLKNFSDEKLVLNFGFNKYLEDCSYGGRLKQGLVLPTKKKAFVSISLEGNDSNNLSPSIEFDDDSLSPLERAYQTLLLLVDKKGTLYEQLFVKPIVNNNPRKNFDNVSITTTPVVDKKDKDSLELKSNVKNKSIFGSLSILGGAILSFLGINHDEQSQNSVDSKKLIKSRIKKQKKENPEFFKEMQKTKNYSDETICVIAEFKKDDPAFADNLAYYSKSRHKKYLNIQETEFLAKNLEENPDFVDKIHSLDRPKATVNVLKLHEKYPKEVEEIFNISELRPKKEQFDNEDIEMLIDAYKLSPDNFKWLANLKYSDINATKNMFVTKRHVFSPNQIANYMSKSNGRKSTAQLIIDLFESNGWDISPYMADWIIQLHRCAAKHPRELKVLTSKEFGLSLDNINEATELYAHPLGPKYFDMGKNTNLKYPHRKHYSFYTPSHDYLILKDRDLIKFVSDSIENDQFLTDIEKKIPNISREINLAEVRHMLSEDKMPAEDREMIYGFIWWRESYETTKNRKITEQIIKEKYPEGAIVIPAIRKLNNLSEEEKKQIDRIIEDGRIPKEHIVDEICKLAPIYAKYPNRKISNAMIHESYIEMLKDAYANPEKYPNLMVRLNGYSLNFKNELSPRQRKQILSYTLDGLGEGSFDKYCSAKDT